MTTYSWTSGVSADWSSAVDWSPFGVPNLSTDDAVIAAPGTYTVTIAAGTGTILPETFTIDSLTESAGTVNVLGTLSANTLTLNGGTFQVENSGKATFGTVATDAGTFGLHNGGVVTVTGSFTNSGTLDVDNAYSTYNNNVTYVEGGSSLTITGTLTNTGIVQVGDAIPRSLNGTSYGLDATTTIALGGLVNNAGDSFVLDGSRSFAATLAFTGGAGAFISNGGLFELTYAAPLVLDNSFTNTGTFGLHNNTAVTVEGNFVNSATLDVDNGYATYNNNIEYVEGGSSLTITGTLTNTGIVQVGDAIPRSLNGTSYGLDATTTIAIGGLVNNAGDSFVLDGSPSFAATLAFTGGAGAFTSNGGHFELTYAAPLVLDNSFTNTGTFGLHNNTAVTVEGNFVNSATLDVDNGYATYNNNIEYVEGGSSLTITGTLTNTGIVQVGDAIPRSLNGTSYGLDATTTIAIGGLVNNAGDSFVLDGSPSFAATLAFTGRAGAFTSNGGHFELTYAAPLVLDNSFTNTGTFGLHNNTAVTVEGNFVNSATLDVDNGYATYNNNIEYVEGGSSLTITGTLTNTGIVQVGDAIPRSLNGTSYGLDATTTIALGGLVNNAGDSFVLDGSPSFAATLAFTGRAGAFISNGGLFELTYAAPLVLDNSFTNTGTFGLHNNTAVTVEGNFVNSATLDVDNGYATYNNNIEYVEGGSSLTITGTLTNTGIVQVGDAILALNAATTVTLGELANSGTVSLDGGSSTAEASLLVNGQAGNAGIFNIGSFSVLDVTGGNAFTQTGGTTTVNGTFSAATIDIDGGTLIFYTTNFTDTGTLAAADGGVINFGAGGLTNLSGTTLTGGTYEVDAGSTLQLPNNVYITTLAADLTLSGTGSVVESLDTGTHVQVQLESTISTIAVGGTLNVAGGRSYTTANSIADAGALKVGGGGIFTAAAVSVAGGAMLTVGAGSELLIGASGELTVNGTLANFGAVSGGGATEVTFGSGTDRLILGPGATFSGTVVGGGANTTLELAEGSGAGTLNGLGTTFTNFGTVTVDAGATWTVDAATSLLATTTFIGDGASSTLVLTGAGTFSLGRVSRFGTIDLPAGNSTVTVTDTTLSGGPVLIRDGASGNNSISAAGDTAAASKGETLSYSAGTGTDSFAGGIENDVVSVSAAAVAGDVLTGGSGTNTLLLRSAGTVSLGGVSNFTTIDLAAGNNTVTVTGTTLSGGSVTIYDGASGNNIISAAGDTSASAGKLLTYHAGSGTDSFTGGFENDTVYVSAAAFGGDVLTGGSGTNTLVLTSAGTFNLSRVSTFTTIDFSAGNNTVYASAKAVSGDVLTGGAGMNTLILTSAGSVNLGGVSKFGTIDLFAGNNTVTVTGTTLSGGSVLIRDGASGNNSISATGDTAAASKGETLSYSAGTGMDSFAGGFENDVVSVLAAAVVAADVLTGGSGANTLLLRSAGTVSLGGVSRFGTIDLFAGNNTVTVTGTTLFGGSVTIYDGASGNNTISAAGDTSASAGKLLTYHAGSGTDSFTGGFENDTVYVSAAAVGSDVLTGGSGMNTLILTSAGSANLGGVSKFGTIDLFAGDNTVTVTDTTLSGGPVLIRDGASGNNSISAAGDTAAASKGETLSYSAGAGTDSFAGGIENDVVSVSAAAVAGDVLTGGSGTNTLLLRSAGTVSLGGVSNFTTIDLAAGNNTVTVTGTTLSGGSVTIYDGASGNNISAAGDTSASAGKLLTYRAGSGTNGFTGGFENDTIYAGTGSGTYTAGSGSDSFVFIKSSLPSQVLDNFQVSSDDILVYGTHSSGGFDLGSTDNALNPTTPTAISVADFVANASGDFTSSGQRFAYDTTNGQLHYSATGSNSSEFLVATLTEEPAISASNFLFEH